MSGLESTARDNDGSQGRSGQADLATPVAALVRDRLRGEGLRGALGYLNGRTRFRFTGVYRMEPEILRTIELFDRENPTLKVSGDIAPLRETYCGIACRTEAPFSTPDALADARLLTHAARQSIISYVGVPIRRPSGAVWGTLCHFDNRPRLIPGDEPHVLEACSRLIACWLQAASLLPG